MTMIFKEENGIYSIDCAKALWATDKMHEDYNVAKIHIKDVDWVIENEQCIYLVEYKNSMIPGAANPETFNPDSDKNRSRVVQKFYDSLHYLKLLNKTKPVQFIYIAEYKNSDKVTRKRLRNKFQKELPFALQENIGGGIKLIDNVDVVSIKEWNENKNYGKYPISEVSINV